MKHNIIPESQIPDARRAVATELNQNEIKFVPSPDEVARRAYFSYGKNGLSMKNAEARAWATVNKLVGDGKKSGSGRSRK